MLTSTRPRYRGRGQKGSLLGTLDRSSGGQLSWRCFAAVWHPKVGGRYGQRWIGGECDAGRCNRACGGFGGRGDGGRAR